MMRAALLFVLAAAAPTAMKVSARRQLDLFLGDGVADAIPATS